MLATDWAFLIADLNRIGLASTVQVSRRTQTGRTPRGVPTASEAPFGDPFPCLLTEDDAFIAANGLGVLEAHGLVGVFPPDSDVQAKDEFEVLDGFKAGSTYRVIEPKAQPGPAGWIIAQCEKLK